VAIEYRWGRGSKTGKLHRDPSLSLRLFDHLVGAGQQRVGYGETERLGRLEVQEKLDFCRLLNRQVRRLLALENAAYIDAYLLERICTVTRIAG
jgi:hypothetical protein